LLHPLAVRLLLVSAIFPIHEIDDVGDVPKAASTPSRNFNYFFSLWHKKLSYREQMARQLRVQ